MKLKHLFESNSSIGVYKIVIDYASIEMSATAVKDRIELTSRQWKEEGSTVEFSIARMTSTPRISIMSNSASALDSVIDDMKQIGIISDTFKATGVRYEVENITENDFSKLPKEVNGDVSIQGDKLESLHDLQKHLTGVNGYLNIFGPLKSSILPILQIKHLKGFVLNIDDKKTSDKLEEILKKYLPNGDILDCQDELIDAGLEEYAKL